MLFTPTPVSVSWPSGIHQSCPQLLHQSTEHHRQVNAIRRPAGLLQVGIRIRISALLDLWCVAAPQYLSRSRSCSDPTSPSPPVPFCAFPPSSRTSPPGSALTSESTRRVLQTRESSRATSPRWEPCSLRSRAYPRTLFIAVSFGIPFLAGPQREIRCFSETFRAEADGSWETRSSPPSRDQRALVRPFLFFPTSSPTQGHSIRVPLLPLTCGAGAAHRTSTTRSN